MRTVMGTQRYRLEFKNLLENIILPEGISAEERNEKLLPLSKFVSEHTPSKLFRYRRCSEMNFAAFNNDELFAVTSDNFNDPYDCLFRFDKKALTDSIFAGMSKETLYAYRELIRSGKDLPNNIKQWYTKDFIEYAKDIVNVDDEIIEESGNQVEGQKDKLSDSIGKLVDDAVKIVKQLAFIVCFSEDIHSVTMWSHYADSHKGYALEYDLRYFQMKCLKCDKFKQCEKAIVGNLYPTIYNRQRYDATEFLTYYIGKGWGLPIYNPDTFIMSKCLLYKSTQWSYEKEWRLILNKMNEFQDKSPICINQIMPNAIYYGTSISPINRKILHTIAQEKGIKEYQMYIENKSYDYSVKYIKYEG